MTYIMTRKLYFEYLNDISLKWGKKATEKDVINYLNESRNLIHEITSITLRDNIK